MGKTKAKHFLRPAIKQVGDRAEFVSQSCSKRKTIHLTLDRKANHSALFFFLIFPIKMMLKFKKEKDG